VTAWRPQESGRLAYAINAALIVGAFALVGRDGVWHAMLSRRSRSAALLGACVALAVYRTLVR